MKSKKKFVLSNEGRRLAIGFDAIADYLFIAKPTAYAWGRKGLFDGCFSRIQKKVYFDLDSIDEKLKPSNHLKVAEFSSKNI